MEIKKFNLDTDYERVKAFLTECYKENKNMVCWLPQRFDDLVFRVDTLYRDERGKLASQDFVYIWEENSNIVGIVVPDGDCFNSSIKNGYEYIFPEMLDLAEEKLKPLFDKKENGKIDFCVVSHDCLKYQADELIKRGYKKGEDSDYDNVAKPLETNYIINLPEGFYLSFGEEFEDNIKAKACHYGFKPQDDDGILTGPFREGILAYKGRKNSSFFKDSFESLVVTNDKDICTFSFCYVDKNTSTAFIEPVCTREKYRKMGLCKEMLHGTINRLKEMNIERAYINSFDWRKKVYNSAGFETEDSIGFWYKEI